jgi:3-phosphoshikimate 1-carboxyvinyltransferase
VKETDRLRAIAENLRAVGVAAEEEGDGLVIQGSDAPLKGRVVTRGDHRIAMAFGILGSLPGNAIEVDDSGCVGVSFPSFWDQLQECRES